MRWWVLLAAAAMLAAGLAGCTRAPPAQAAAPSPTKDAGPERLSRPGHGGGGRGQPKEPVGDGNVTLRELSESVGLQLTSANAVIDLGSFQGTNCLQVGPAPFTIVGGNVSAEWTAQSALTQSLVLLIDDPGDRVSQDHPGPSPINVAFRSLPKATEKPYYGYYDFGLRLDGPASAAYQQDASLTLTLQYEADHDLEAALSYC